MEHDTTPYEPPSIEERTPVALPLIGTGIGSGVTAPSAVFRPSYEPPSIEERSPIALPLVATAVGSGPAAASAAFRPSPTEPYEAPRVDARDPIGLPLIGGPATSVAIVAPNFQS